MPREATLFESTNGQVVEAYLALRESGANVPPMWIERARLSRKKKEKELAKLLKAGSLDAVGYLREWEFAYRKECFYHGIRVLMELERQGRSKL
jgi:hypothetical protein